MKFEFALVIGDSNYLNLPRLVNPENDAHAIADLLKKMGFNTRMALTDLRGLRDSDIEHQQPYRRIERGGHAAPSG